MVERAREDFWSSRLAGADPKAEWMKWQAWLEHKHEQIVRLVPFRLGEIDIELTLPPEPDANPARGRAAGRTGLELAMRIRIIDAFTDRPFGGNPAAVCLLDDADTWPDEAWMQQVAAEMHLSETAFAHPLSDGGEADWALRWFTPEVETNLCGHATLATAYAMYYDRGAPGTLLACETRSMVAWSVRASTEFGLITGGSRVPHCAADRSWTPTHRTTSATRRACRPECYAPAHRPAKTTISCRWAIPLTGQPPRPQRHQPASNNSDKKLRHAWPRTTRPNS